MPQQLPLYMHHHQCILVFAFMHEVYMNVCMYACKNDSDEIEEDCIVV